MTCSCNHACNCNNYGCLSFLGDLFMLAITGGLWAIWIFCRELRRRR